MHKLEYALFALSTIVEKENHDSELANELRMLVTASHNYSVPNTEDLSEEYIKEMHQRADKYIIGH